MNHSFADNKAQLYVYRANNGKFWVIIDRQMGPNNGPKAIVYKRIAEPEIPYRSCNLQQPEPEKYIVT